MKPDFVIAANCDEIPTTDKWTEMMQKSSSGEALKLRQHAIMCLHQNVQEQRWGELIGISERVLGERGIGF
jgi:hypothetical protein